MLTPSRHRLPRICSALAVVAGLTLSGPFVSAASAAPKQSDPTDVADIARNAREIEEAFKTSEEGIVPVIVSLRPDPLATAEPAKERHFKKQQDALLDKLQRASLRGLKALDGAPFVSMHVTRPQFAVLRTLPQVQEITLDRVTEAAGTSYYGGASGQQLPSMWDIPRIGADWTNNNGWTGRGMKVAIIDSGVDRNNPYLQGRVLNEACFATNPNGTGACPNGGTYQYAATTAGVTGSAVWSSCTFEHFSCSHGTHVAQSAAGAYGVARGASIVAIRAGHKAWSTKYNRYAVSFNTSDILNSLWYVHTILPKSQIIVAAVNVSIGSDAVYAGTCDSVSPSVTDYITKLRSTYRIPTVISSGNGNSAGGVSWPACISTAVAVGNSTLTAASGGSDAVFGGGEGGSNSSYLIDLLAPGTDVCSAVPTWLRSNGWECGWFGTSMAAPHVAGAMAVLTQKRPSATVDQLIAALHKAGPTGGVSVTDSRNNVTRTRINVANAVYYNI